MQISDKVFKYHAALLPFFSCAPCIEFVFLSCSWYAKKVNNNNNFLWFEKCFLYGKETESEKKNKINAFVNWSAVHRKRQEEVDEKKYYCCYKYYLLMLCSTTYFITGHLALLQLPNQYAAAAAAVTTLIIEMQSEGREMIQEGTAGR